MAESLSRDEQQALASRTWAIPCCPHAAGWTWPCSFSPSHVRHAAVLVLTPAVGPWYNAAMKSYRYLDLIMALFVAVLLISNVASAKILDLGPFTFDGGTILFPLSYIFGDVLTGVYGDRRSG